VSSRQHPALAAPGNVTGFPSWRLRRTQRVFRAHRAELSPWWFSSSGQGRFDLPPPDGTCYVASDAQAALRERLGDSLVAAGVVPASLIDGAVVSTLTVPRGSQLADTTAEGAADFVTREISTITPYEVPQAWARALRADGHGGIRYQPRFTTSPRTFAYALFGAAGMAAWAADPAPLAAAEVAARARVTVERAPRLARLTILSRQDRPGN
jgi:hypothetical protein